MAYQKTKSTNENTQQESESAYSTTNQTSVPWTKENTFIFVILGSRTNKIQTSGFKKDIKYTNYLLISDAILIRRLALKHLKLDPNHIIIFAHGDKKDFDLKTNEILIQLTINDIYRTTLEEEDLKFSFYTEIDKIEYYITTSLEEHPDAHIILFLDDNGNSFPFLNFYLFFMTIKHSSLHILNDGCYMIIDLLDYYFTISESLKLNHNKISTRDLLFITFIANELQPNKKIEDLKYIFSIIQNCHQNDRKKNKLIKMIVSIYDTLNHKDLFTNDLTIKLKDIPFSNDIDDLLIVKNVDFLSQIGISTLQDILDLYKFIFCFGKTYGTQKDFQLIYTKINSITQPIQAIQKSFNCNNSKLYEIIKILSKQNNDFVDYLYDKHPDHYLITSWHKEGLPLTFGTRRIGINNKLIAGSPAMSAFIIEILFFPNGNGINIDRIRRIACETSDSYKEYAIQSSIEFKEWHRLYLSEWKSSVHANKSFIKNNDNMNEATIEEVMNSVGFKLAVKFSDDDIEIPINLNSNEKERGHRCRLTKKDQEKPYDGITNIQKEDLYYSDDESESHIDINEK